MTEAQVQRLAPGDHVTYMLAPYKRPTHPDKRWHGRIEAIYLNGSHLRVTVLDEGYEGEDEYISNTETLSAKRGRRNDCKVQSNAAPSLVR